MLICKTIEISVLNVNSNSFPGELIIGTFEKWASGLKLFFLGLVQPCPHSAFPWLQRWGAPPPKPGKSTMGTRLGLVGLSSWPKNNLGAWGPSPRSNTDTIANWLTSQVSPHVTEFKTLPSHGFQILDSSLCQWNLDSRAVVLDCQEKLMKIAILISALYKFYYYYYYYYSGLHSLQWSYSTCLWSTTFL